MQENLLFCFCCFACCSFAALLVVFVVCAFCSLLENSCGNQQINVEFKIKSIGIKEEIKKNRNTKGNSRNQSGIKWIQQIKEEIKWNSKNFK
jgi:hypothetical protein